MQATNMYMYKHKQRYKRQRCFNRYFQYSHTCFILFLQYYCKKMFELLQYALLKHSFMITFIEFKSTKRTMFQTKVHLRCNVLSAVISSVDRHTI